MGTDDTGDFGACGSTISVTRMSSTRQKIFPAKAEIPNHQTYCDGLGFRLFQLLKELILNRTGLGLCTTGPGLCT